MAEQRPDPDVLLARVQRDEAKRKRGRLKIFFGAAAGVGKTYAMLLAAREKRAEGLVVVIGIVETHKRADTAALLEGLEILPARTIEYRGAQLREFDLDAALKRCPTLIIVDEFAHTSAPGSRHPKRWNDVEELLDAGIDVYTALNVQHLESLNDVVGGITGVRVQETVPDTVFDRADEVELVDLPPDELLERLKEGKVYLPAQAKAAVENFFRKGNLIALRELSLRRTAERVDEQMRVYREDEGISEVWQAGELILVCIGPGELAERLIRAGRRFAAALHADWIVAYIETPQLQRLPPPERDAVMENLRLAQGLGEAQILHDGVALRRRQALQLRGLDVGDDPVGMQRGGEAAAGANQALRELARADAHEDQLACLPHLADALVLAVDAHLLVHALGGAAQGQLAQRDQVALAEEILDRGFRLRRKIDLAFLQTLEQLVGREVHQLDLVGTVEHRIRHGLLHAHAGDPTDDVVQALQVLDIEGRIHVDPRVEQLLDVVPALGVARAGGVGVGELVDDDESRATLERGVEVELAQLRTAVLHRPCGEDFEAIEKRRRVGALVRLDDADDDVRALGALLARGEQHGVGLAHAGRRAEEDLQLAASALCFVALHPREQSVRIGALFGHYGRKYRMPVALPERVEREVEPEHVDARLAEDSELPAFGRVGNERSHSVR